MSDLLVESPAPAVRLVTLNRLKVRNAINTSMLTEIADTLERAAADDAVRCLVLTGGPDVFAAGADLNEVAELDRTDALDNNAVYRAFNGAQLKLNASFFEFETGKLILCA